MRRTVINLTEQEFEFLQSAISGGLCETIEEAVHNGLKLLKDECQDYLEMRARVLTSLEQAENGELIDGETAVNNAFLAAERRIKQKQTDAK